VRPAKPQLVALEIKGRHFVFDVNSLFLLQCDGDQAAAILANPPTGLILGAPFEPYLDPPQPGKIKKVTLNLTQECNLNCRYCFSEHRPGVMSKATIDGAVALLKDAPLLDVSFFGGEPLLAYDAMRYAVEQTEKVASKRHIECRFHLTTNGVLVEPMIAKYLAAHKFSVLVSLDGDREDHAAYRGGFDETMRAIRFLAEAGVRSREVRATYTARWMHLVRRAQYLYRLQCDGRIQGFSIEPASCEPWDRELLEAEYAALGKWYIGAVQEQGLPAFFHFTLFVRRLRTAQPHLSACGAGNGYVTVGPEGIIYACHRQGRSAIGNVEDGIDEKRRMKWTDNRLFAHENCRHCWARFVCGGGCREAHCAETGAIDTPGTSCLPIKATIKESMWILSELKGTPNATRADL